MKRLLYIAIVLGACAFFAYPYFTTHKQEVSSFLDRTLPAFARGGSKPEAPSEPAKVEPTPLPRLAPPGIFYMVERVSIHTPSGISAVDPGDEVRLMQRKKNGTLHVTAHSVDFDVKPSQVTNNLDVALLARQQAGLPPRH